MRSCCQALLSLNCCGNRSKLPERLDFQDPGSRTNTPPHFAARAREASGIRWAVVRRRVRSTSCRRCSSASPRWGDVWRFFSWSAMMVGEEQSPNNAGRYQLRPSPGLPRRWHEVRLRPAQM